MLAYYVEMRTTISAKVNRERAGRVIEKIRSLDLFDEFGNEIGHVSFTQYGRGSTGFLEVNVDGDALSVMVHVDPHKTGPEMLTTNGAMWRFRSKEPRERFEDRKKILENFTAAPVRIKAYYLEVPEVDAGGPSGRVGSLRLGAAVPDEEEEI